MQTLIDTTTGDRIEVGQTVTDFRGETATVTGWSAPHKPSSTGRIHVEGELSGSFYPSVFSCAFVELDPSEADSTPDEMPLTLADKVRMASVRNTTPSRQLADEQAINLGGQILRDAAERSRNKAEDIDTLTEIRSISRTANEIARRHRTAESFRQRAADLDRAAEILDSAKAEAPPQEKREATHTKEAQLAARVGTTEARIITRLVRQILAAGHRIDARDEEAEDAVVTRTVAETLDRIGHTEQTVLDIYADAKSVADETPHGWFCLIHGNGEDVISDFSDRPDFALWTERASA